MTATPNPAKALRHIEQLWPRLIRRNPQDSGTLIGLPRPYFVPRDGGANGGMFQEMYYWDSYFISLGLVGTPLASGIVDIAENFAALVERFGLIPNGSRYYFLSRSQPPFFTRQIALALANGLAPDPAWLRRMAALAERELETVWMGEHQPHHRRVYAGLSRYFDINYLDMLASCESGWDHSTRCDDAWLDHVPVDLNSLLYVAEGDLADFADRLGDAARAAHWRARAMARQATLQRLFWDEDAGLFLDFNFRRELRNPLPSLATFYPLWAGWATPDQAARIVAQWLPRFLQPGGCVCSLDTRAGRQWAWPNGWAPLQWLVASGLDRYGFAAEARDVRRRWVRTCVEVFERDGAMHEKYNVVEPDVPGEAGLYGHLQGFGWTNGVLVDFVRQGL